MTLGICLTSYARSMLISYKQVKTMATFPTVGAQTMVEATAALIRGGNRTPSLRTAKTKNSSLIVAYGPRRSNLTVSGWTERRNALQQSSRSYTAGRNRNSATRIKLMKRPPGRHSSRARPSRSRPSPLRTKI